MADIENKMELLLIIIIIMQNVLAGASTFPRYHATDHGHKFCAGPTTVPGSDVWGRSRWCVAMFDEGDHEVVSTPSAGHAPALRARVWSSSESERMTWPKNLKRLSMTVWVTGGWVDRRQTSWLVTWAVKGTRRMCWKHHWSNASSRWLDLTVMSHISEPYSDR